MPLFNVLLLVGLVSTQSIYDCPPNLPKDRYLQVFQSSCYRFVFNKLRVFGDARIECHKGSVRGELATVKTADVQKFIMNQLINTYNFRSQIWIGLEDEGRGEGEYYWTDGTSLKYYDYSNWGLREGPKSLGGSHTQDCVVIDASANGVWRDERCFSFSILKADRPFICEYKITPNVPQTTSTKQQSASTTKMTTATSTEIRSFTASPTPKNTETTSFSTTATTPNTELSSTTKLLVNNTGTTSFTTKSTPLNAGQISTTTKSTTKTTDTTSSTTSNTKATFSTTKSTTKVTEGISSTIKATSNAGTTFSTTKPMSKFSETISSTTKATAKNVETTFSTIKKTTKNRETTSFSTKATIKTTETASSTKSTASYTSKEASKTPTGTTSSDKATSTSTGPTTTAPVTCPAFQCELDCGMDGYKLNNETGCALCECNPY